MIQQLEDKLSNLISGSDQLMGVVQAKEHQISSLTSEVAKLEEEVSTLTYTSTALEQLLKAVSVESLVSVEQLVTYGLRVIFEDRSLAFKIEVSTKRGQQWMQPILIENGVEAPILDSFGGGPASVVSFLLRLIICRKMKLAPLILMDEPFSFVSEGYASNVAKLLKELTSKLGLTMILVTHDKEFVTYADKAYQAVETSTGTIFKPMSL